jgi:hypothetical protein
MTISRVRTAAAAVAIATFFASILMVTGVRAQTATPYGTNLVVNGDAEVDAGAKNSSTIVSPASWVTTGQFDVVAYGASGGFPDGTSPGPTDRGKNLFEGGNVAKSTAMQTISLTGASADINAGIVKYVLSAYLGGYSNQGDYATVSVAFKDANGATVGTGTTIGPVTPAQRKGTTGSIAQSAPGTVPKGATTALVTIVITRLEGTYNDGSADNVSLVLSKAT